MKKFFITILMVLVLTGSAFAWSLGEWKPPQATETKQGVSELATNAETVTGTATDKVTTPANIAALNADSTTNLVKKNITATATLGTELITWTAAGWNETGDWTFAASTLTHVTGNVTAVTGTVTGALTAGVTYKVTITGTGGTATATYTLGGVTGTTIAASGAIAITDYITATADSELVITPSNTCTVALTLVSVKALTDATGDLTAQGDLFVGSTIKSPGGSGGINILPSGYIGIGTTDPDSILHLYTATGSIWQTFETDNEAQWAQFRYKVGATNDARITIFGDNFGAPRGNTFEIDLNAGAMDFVIGKTDCSTRLLTIKNSGNVGIGTSAPDVPLEVNSATGLGVRVTYNDSDGTAANHGDLTVGATGDVTLTATGTNPNIILTPTGAGGVDLNGAVTAPSVTIDRVDAPQFERFYEATSDGDNYIQVNAKADDTGFTETGTIRLPDSGTLGGVIPIIVSQGWTQTDCTGAADDITGSSITIPDDTFKAGKTLKWIIAGTITGATNTKKFYLYVDDAVILTCTLSAAAAGDFSAEFTMSELTGFANQKCFGSVLTDGSVPRVDYAADTTDFSTGAKTVKLQGFTTDAGDHILVEYVRIEYFDTL